MSILFILLHVQALFWQENVEELESLEQAKIIRESEEYKGLENFLVRLRSQVDAEKLQAYRDAAEKMAKERHAKYLKEYEAQRIKEGKNPKTGPIKKIDLFIRDIEKEHGHEVMYLYVQAAKQMEASPTRTLTKKSKPDKSTWLKVARVLLGGATEGEDEILGLSGDPIAMASPYRLSSFEVEYEGKVYRIGPDTHTLRVALINTDANASREAWNKAFGPSHVVDKKQRIENCETWHRLGRFTKEVPTFSCKAKCDTCSILCKKQSRTEKVGFDLSRMSLVLEKEENKKINEQNKITSNLYSVLHYGKNNLSENCKDLKGIEDNANSRRNVLQYKEPKLSAADKKRIEAFSNYILPVETAIVNVPSNSGGSSSGLEPVGGTN